MHNLMVMDMHRGTSAVICVCSEISGIFCAIIDGHHFCYGQPSCLLCSFYTCLVSFAE